MHSKATRAGVADMNVREYFTAERHGQSVALRNAEGDYLAASSKGFVFASFDKRANVLPTSLFKLEDMPTTQASESDNIQAIRLASGKYMGVGSSRAGELMV